MVPRASVALALTGLALGCTRDFDTFRGDGDGAVRPEPTANAAVVDAASGDAALADADAAVDAGSAACVVSSCVDARARCVAQCEQRRKVCVVTCFGNDDCDKACLDAEASCGAGCGDECSRCHANAGCANPCP